MNQGDGLNPQSISSRQFYEIEMAGCNTSHHFDFCGLTTKTNCVMLQRSQSASKQKDQDDDYDQSQSAAWVVSPRAAIRPCRKSSQKQQNQHHHKNRVHLHLRVGSNVVAQRSAITSSLNRLHFCCSDLFRDSELSSVSPPQGRTRWKRSAQLCRSGCQ